MGWMRKVFMENVAFAFILRKCWGISQVIGEPAWETASGGAQRSGGAQESKGLTEKRVRGWGGRSLAEPATTETAEDSQY